MQCELVDVNAAEDACLYVTENCPPESLIDYYNNHFCLFADIQWLSYVLLVRISALPIFACSRSRARSSGFL